MSWSFLVMLLERGPRLHVKQCRLLGTGFAYREVMMQCWIHGSG